MFSLISQLSHVEIVTPRLEQSHRFFYRNHGFAGDCTYPIIDYLRAWRNFFHHDLVLTEGETPALGHIGWRSAGEAALETAVARLERAGAGLGWHIGEPGRPRGYR